MKKSCLFALLFSCIGTVGNSQTVDISTLSDYEKQVHRIAWCDQFYRFELYNEIPDLNMKKIREIRLLLERNGFMDRDYSRKKVYGRTIDDLKTQFIIGEITFTQSDADSCDQDMRKILAKEYIPNFSYMDK
jgi:hypothetical protein